MSEPVYYEGLTIEFDTAARRLTIEGPRVPVDGTDGQFTSTELPGVSKPTFLELSKAIVDQSLEGRHKLRKLHEETLKTDVRTWNMWRRDNPEVRPILYGLDLSKEAIPQGLAGANLSNAVLIEANLRNQHLEDASFHEANLGGANASGAILTHANFCRADLFRTNLSGAKLHGANLQGTQLAGTKFLGAHLVGCTLYGLSAWDLEIDEKTVQEDLTILYTPKTVEKPRGRDTQQKFNAHDVRVAQFIYLLLDNARIRDVFDTTTAKVVLILGRFEPKDEYKATLDVIWNEIYRRGYAPVIFNFEKPDTYGYIEMITALAGISRFIIADITDAHTVPQELAKIVETFPSKPVQPIILQGKREYLTFEELQLKLLPLHRYTDRDRLKETLFDDVIEPVERWIAMKATGDVAATTPTERQLQEEKIELQRQVEELERRLRVAEG